MDLLRGLLKYYSRIPAEWKGVCLLFCIIVCFIAIWWIQTGKITVYRAVAIIFLSTYMFLVMISTVFARPVNEEYQFSFDLFWSYRRIKAGEMYLFGTNIYNILMLMPMGGLLPIALHIRNGGRMTILIGVLSSLSIELFQLVTKRGMFELDDLFHNTIGVILGYLIYKLTRILFRIIQKRR